MLFPMSTDLILITTSQYKVNNDYNSKQIKPLRLSPNIHIPTTFELPTDVTSSYSPTHLSLASSSSLTTAITTTTTVSTPSSSSNPLTDLISLLSNLHGDINSNSVPIAFIVNATELDGLSLYFLLGRVRSSNLSDPWSGLIGVGVTS